MSTEVLDSLTHNNDIIEDLDTIDTTLQNIHNSDQEADKKEEDLSNIKISLMEGLPKMLRLILCKYPEIRQS